MLDRLRRRAEKTEARPSIELLAARRESCVKLDCIQPRELVEIVGEVMHVCTINDANSTTFEIEVSDGTGSLVARWNGRGSIAGIERGRRLAIWGRAAPMRKDDSLVVFNPRYELLP